MNLKTGEEETWNLLATEHGKTSENHSPFCNPGKTERGIPNLNFKKHIVILILNFSFKYYLVVIFTGFDIYTRQVLCFQRCPSYFQNSVLESSESWNCPNHFIHAKLLCHNQEHGIFGGILWFLVYFVLSQIVNSLALASKWENRKRVRKNWVMHYKLLNETEFFF